MGTVSSPRLESAAYWICFIAVFLAVAIWESFQTEHALSVPAERRWKNHGVMLAIGAGLNTLLFRLSPVAVAIMVQSNRFGLLNKPGLPLAVRCVLTVLLLDLLQYWIHWSFHHAAWLWRVHSVHHSDPDYDVSTAARFHPLEILYSQGIRFVAIAVLAPPVAGVFAAELLTVLLNLFAHANAALPAPAERLLRAIFVTPDLHRIHHSEDPGEQMRNLGQTFPWWDRLFRSYAACARATGANFRTGLKGAENRDRLAIRFMLAQPFQVPEPLPAIELGENPAALAPLLASPQDQQSADQ